MEPWDQILHTSCIIHWVTLSALNTAGKNQECQEWSHFPSSWATAQNCHGAEQQEPQGATWHGVTMEVQGKAHQQQLAPSCPTAVWDYHNGTVGYTGFSSPAWLISSPEYKFRLLRCLCGCTWFSNALVLSVRHRLSIHGMVWCTLAVSLDNSYLCTAFVNALCSAGQ